MRTADWVAIHRKHHAKVETPDDPHSPALRDRSSAFKGSGSISYEKGNSETIQKYSQNCPNDWVETCLHRQE